MHDDDDDDDDVDDDRDDDDDDNATFNATALSLPVLLSICKRIIIKE